MYQFGPFRLDTQSQVLVKGQQPVSLTPKALQTLQVLVERAGRVVGRDELIEAVWPDSFVEEAVLTQNIYTLRKVLAEEADQGNDRGPAIETLRGRGYRFTLAVESIALRKRAPRVLAVLPFEPFGLGDDGEVLGLAMADALITRLSSLSSVVVRPTHAVRSFSAGVDPIEIARRLRVEAIITGTLRRAGAKLRIGAQMIQEGAESPLWAGQVEALETDLFSAEDQLFDDLARALRPGASQPSQVEKRREPAAGAHRAYLRGRFFWNKRAGQDLEQAIRCFEQAIDLDPGYAPAYAGLADSYVLQPFYAGVEPSVAFPRARRAAQRALELDERLPAAHTSLAYSQFFYDWSWRDAEAGFQRALELDPSYATARHWRGFSWLALQRFRAAIEELERAVELDPLSLVVNADLGLAHYFHRDYPRAIEQFEAALELDSSFAYADFGLALARCARGELEPAIAAARRASRNASGNNAMNAVLGYTYAVAGDRRRALEIESALAGDTGTKAGHFALLYAGLGPPEKALEWLDRAVEERSRFVLYVGIWPAFDSLRSRPEVERMMARLALPT